MKIEAPTRVTRNYTQQLVASPDQVFPLLCPVREAEWLERWDPLFVASHSGVAERDCVFVTSGTPHDAIWYITRHEPEHGFVEMIKITPGVTACKLSIALRPAATGSLADVSYSHTSLGPQGDAFVASFSAEYYEQFMRDWERRINHFLAQGSLLRTES